jgi:hypothetical protein
MVGTSLTEPPKKIPNFKWMSKKMWCGVCEMQDKFEQLFNWLVKSFHDYGPLWEQFYTAQNPAEVEFPIKFHETYNQFHFAMLVKLIRPD